MGLRALPLFVALLAACGSFDPRPIGEVPFRERVMTKTEVGLTVGVTVLDDAESKAVFGRDLAGKSMQPVWIEVENRTAGPWVVLPAGADPDYFAPYEAAYQHRITWGGSVNDRIADHFMRLTFVAVVRPGERNRGFVLTHLDRGAKSVTVELASTQGIRRFRFLVPVDNLKADYAEVDFDRIFPPEEVVDHKELDALRAAIEALPRATRDSDGKDEGDPLNFVVIGPRLAVAAAFAENGWHATETVHGGSAWRTGVSFVFGTRYRYSPVSPLYAFGRKQDAAFQKARDNIHVRNHLRLWQAPFTWQGRTVFLGQISRDVGVRWSKRTVVTHKIDPWVDEARWQLMQEMIRNQAIARIGYTAGVDVSEPESPRFNLGGDPYYTDGLRAVFFLADEPVPIDEVEVLSWEWPGTRRPQEQGDVVTPEKIGERAG